MSDETPRPTQEEYRARETALSAIRGALEPDDWFIAGWSEARKYLTGLGYTPRSTLRLQAAADGVCPICGQDQFRPTAQQREKTLLDGLATAVDLLDCDSFDGARIDQLRKLLR